MWFQVLCFLLSCWLIAKFLRHCATSTNEIWEWIGAAVAIAIFVPVVYIGLTLLNG